MEQRVKIRWTATARDQLSKLSAKVRRGLLDNANALREADDPAKVHKALIGPLQGYSRLTCARWRAVYRVDEEQLESGDVVIRVTVTFIAVGKRKERDRKDIYAVAKRMVELGLVQLPDDDDDIDP